MRKNILFVILLFSSLMVFAQPSAIPAPGYQWVKTDTASYYSFLVGTIPNIITGSTSFGVFDKDPADCSAHCGGNCDGIGTYAVSLFGINNTVPIGTNGNCEQRAIVINHWPNDFLDAGVSNGASNGKVYLPTSAKLTMKKSAVPLTPGCGAGSSGNKGKIFGGNGPGNTTKLNVVCNYDISWSSTAFGGIVSGGQSWIQNGNFTGEEPGSGNYSDYIDWIAGGFGNTIDTDSVYYIPASAVGQTGGNFEIVVVSSPTISVTREFGNADGLAESAPGMEGLADYRVQYDIWELQQTVPLRLGNFTGRLLSGSSAILNWINFSDFDNDRYIIERSYDGRHWQAAGTIAALTNTTAHTGQYSFTDKNIAAGESNIFYRLKLIERSGAVIYSTQVLIRNGQQVALSLVPTGSKNEYRLISSNRGNCNICIVNTNGQVVKQFVSGSNDNNIINLNNLPSALYSIIVQQEDKREIVRAFVY